MKTVRNQEEEQILEKYRQAAFDGIWEEEKKTLWRRIEHTVSRRFFLRYYPWVAAASVALLLGMGYWWLSDAGSAPEQLAAWQIVRTEAQQRQKITLPDSSVVWLNANSCLEYPDCFADNERTVRLNGEAYFEVKEDLVLPFVVRTETVTVKVLGTVFNLAAYHGDVETVATLLKGKIAVHTSYEQKPETLTPNRQAVYRKDTHSLTVSAVNPETYTSWINGYYKFNNMSFAQIAKQFEKWYGVAFVFESEQLKAMTYTGTFLQEQRLETILMLLQELNAFKYRIENHQIYVSP
ncbi:MAG: FecR family protein [Bacteroidales bacterium]|nr:FecR family protein [Bacteroidales bacterium]